MFEFVYSCLFYFQKIPSCFLFLSNSSCSNLRKKISTQKTNRNEWTKKIKKTNKHEYTFFFLLPIAFFLFPFFSLILLARVFVVQLICAHAIHSCLFFIYSCLCFLFVFVFFYSFMFVFVYLHCFCFFLFSFSFFLSQFFLQNDWIEIIK